jgi:hypothetical protein
VPPRPFNLSRLYARRESSDAQRAALVVADSNDRQLTADMSEYRGRSQNRTITSCLPGAESAYVIALTRVSPELTDEIRRTLLRPYVGDLSEAQLQRIVIGVLAWLLLAALLPLARVPSEHCRECGTPTSRFVYRTAYLESRCVLCYQLHAIKAQLTFPQQHARDHRARSRTARIRGFASVLGTLSPGAGLLFRGSVVPGLLIALTAAIGAAVISVSGSLLAAPLHFEPAFSFDGRAPLGLGMLALGYGASLLAELVVAWRNR